MSKQDAFPIPDICDALDCLRDMKYYATIDLLPLRLLAVGDDRHKYLLVATDYFTKWAEAYPLKDAEASTCCIITSSHGRAWLASYTQIEDQT